MNKAVSSFCVLVFCCVSLAGCGLFDRGACDYKSGEYYFCMDNWDPRGCTDLGDEGYSAFYKDMSCYDIGYTDSGVLHTSPYSPGGGGGGGGGGGDVPGYCTSTYNGPESDPQTWGYCWEAWNYLCIEKLGADSQQVTLNCSIYNQWRVDNPGLAPCGYCP